MASGLEASLEKQGGPGLGGGAVLKPASGDLGSYPETLSQGFPSLQNKGLN